MNRKKPAGRRDQSVGKKMDWKALEIVHPEAAGIDVGGSEHWVAINPERDTEPVRRFRCFTDGLREMALWLVEKGVRSVAMQSTGVYWMPAFEILEHHGLEVYLVNAQHTNNVPGRKVERYSGVPVVAEVTRIRPAEQQLSADRRGSCRSVPWGDKEAILWPRPPAPSSGCRKR